MGLPSCTSQDRELCSLIPLLSLMACYGKSIFQKSSDCGCEGLERWRSCHFPGSPFQQLNISTVNNTTYFQLELVWLQLPTSGSYFLFSTRLKRSSASKAFSLWRSLHPVQATAGCSFSKPELMPLLTLSLSFTGFLDCGSLMLPHQTMCKVL